MQIASVVRSIRDAHKEVTKNQTSERKAASTWIGDISSFSARSLESLILANAHYTQWQAILDEAQKIAPVADGRTEVEMNDFSDQVVLDATTKVRRDVQHWLANSRVTHAGIDQEISTAQHNAASRFLSRTAIVELLDNEDDLPVPTPLTIDGRVNLHLTPPDGLIVARYEKPDERILADSIFVGFILEGPNQWAVSDVHVNGRILNDANKPGRRRADAQFSGSLADYGDEIPQALVKLIDGALRLLNPSKEN